MTPRLSRYLLAGLLISLNALSQKYNFVNWTVEDGLIQSQASIICQDNYRQLWIGTEGGLSRFDGKKFTGYTVQDGLITNRITTMHSSSGGDLWIGTNYGISHFNGSKFTPVRIGSGATNNILAIEENTDHIFVLSNFELYSIDKFSSTKTLVSGDSTEKVTSIYSDKQGTMLAWVYQKGIYCLKNNSWQQVAKTLPSSNTLARKFFISTVGDTFIITNQGILRLKGGLLEQYTHPALNFNELNILCIAEDSKQNIWLGSDNGVYKIEGKQVLHFNEKSGFTDNSVNNILKDSENNLWFATNGDGIYKFRENTFTYYDKSTGLYSSIVMGVAQTPDGQIYAGGYGGGLYKINKTDGLQQVQYNGPVLADSKINCLYADADNSLYIGTLYKGIWTYHIKNGLQPLATRNMQPVMRGVTCFLRDKKGNLLIGSQQGLFIKDKTDSIGKIKINVALITALRQFDNDHILVGTSKGIYLLDQFYHAELFEDKLFANASVLCLAAHGKNIWVGTTDKGVLNWNSATGKMVNYSTANGLPSNFIYSIDVSDNKRAWIGTGFGISNLQLDNDGKVLAIKNYGRSDGLLGMECNHNSLLKARDSSLWFGTTKGLFHFKPNTEIAEKNQPFVILRSVKLFSDPISDSSLFEKRTPWFNVPAGLRLQSKQNHLSFELSAIYFTNPEDVLFKYKLEGIDKAFTLSNNPLIIYPALPPGKYLLKVLGVTKSGVLSSNTISYSFEITKAFYQTRFFQVMVILLLISTGAIIAYLLTRGRQKRKQRQKEIHEKIREEEFIKLRQRTAEDFHDEMGNSLTRISVLTDVLKSKINGKEVEVTKLVQQIKENTTALYNGSRDIIWSLNSQNDGLLEIIEHSRDIGNELFQDADLEFHFEHNIVPDNSLKLKLDYSRNLIMIFKEAYNNIIKHSSARVVKIFAELTPANELHIFIRDNGRGFSPDLALNGNGMRNMKNRAQRMNGQVNISTAPTKGTELHFILKNIFN